MQSLVNSITEEKRAATLVYGDSAIGKTTLLKDLNEHLWDDNDVLVGFYQTPSGDTDPLLKCLSDLLKRIYSFDHIEDQIAAACAKATKNFSISGLRKFLLKILKLAGHSEGLGLFAKTAVGAFEAVADVAMSLDVKIEGNDVKLGIDSFRDILAILQSALPNRKFVFVIDNLNAATGSVTSQIPEAFGFHTIETYLSSDFRESSNVYFVFSWKRDEANDLALAPFIKILREYGGKILYLRALKNEADVDGWLRNSFVWYAGLSDVERLKIIRMSGGLPEIIVNWRDSGPSDYQESVLARIAREVREGKYSGLQERICTSSATEKKVLFSLALLNQPIPVRVLCEIVGVAYENCLQTIQKWSRTNLLLAQVEVDSKEHHSFYAFDHETKRLVVLNSLRDLLESPSADARGLYDYLLRTLQRDWLPFSTHITTALEISKDPPLNISPAEDALLKQLLEMAKTEKAPTVATNSHWTLVDTLPPATLGQYLAFCLHCDFGDEEIVLKTIKHWIRGLPENELGSKPEATATAAALTHVCQHLRGPSLESYLAALARIRKIYDAFPLDIGLAGLYSVALATGAHVWAPNAIFRETNRELKNLINKFPQANGIRESASLYAYYISHYYDVRGDMTKALAQLSHLSEIYSSTEPTQRQAEIRCRAVNRLLVSQSRPGMSEGLGLLDDLRAIYARFSNSPLIAEDLAEALFFCVGYVEERPELAKSYYQDLKQIYSHFPKQVKIVYQVSNGATILASKHAICGDGRVEGDLQKQITDFGKMTRDALLGLSSESNELPSR
jgi:hypothetical protein